MVNGSGGQRWVYEGVLRGGEEMEGEREQRYFCCSVWEVIFIQFHSSESFLSMFYLSLFTLDKSIISGPLRI